MLTMEHDQKICLKYIFFSVMFTLLIFVGVNILYFGHVHKFWSYSFGHLNLVLWVFLPIIWHWIKSTCAVCFVLIMNQISVLWFNFDRVISFLNELFYFHWIICFQSNVSQIFSQMLLVPQVLPRFYSFSHGDSVTYMCDGTNL